MPLTCYCGDDDYEWYATYGGDYQEMRAFSRRRRCASCRELIDPGTLVLEFSRRCSPRSYIEERIYGDGPTVPLAPMWHCERCADLFFSLTELGYGCISPDENMTELVAEYAQIQRESHALAPRF